MIAALLLLLAGSLVALLLGGMLLLGGHDTLLYHLVADANGWVMLLSTIGILVLLYTFTQSVARMVARRFNDLSRRYSNLVGAAPHGMVVLTDERVAFINREAARLLGLTGPPEDMNGMPWRVFVAEADRSAVERYLKRLTPGRAGRFLPLRLQGGGQQLQQVMAAATPCQFEGRHSVLITLSHYYSWPRYQRLLSRREQQRAAALDHIDCVVFEVNSDGQFVQLNPAWQEMTGFAPAACLGRRLTEFLHPDELVARPDWLSSLLDRPGSVRGSLETRFLTQTGGFRWVDLRYRMIQDADGAPVMIGTLNDITQRKTVEERQRAGRRTLSALVDHLPGMVYRCRNDRAWSMEYVNEKCFELTGYEPGELMHNEVGWADLIHPEDREWVWRLLQGKMRAGKEFFVVYRLVTRSQEVKRVYEFGRGIYSSGGDLLAVEGFITDLGTERLPVNA